MSVEFETKIKSFFRLLGYDVETKRVPKNVSCDFQLQRSLPGIGISVFGVDCIARSRRLGREPVSRIATKYADLRAQGVLSTGILVTSVGFTKDAIRIAKSKKLTLLTLQELQAQVLDVDGYLAEVVHRLSYVEHDYVDLEVSPASSNERRSAMHVLEGWREGPGESCLLLLGAAGTGKSTICNRLSLATAKSYLDKSAGSRIPISVSGRELAEHKSLLQAFAAQLARHGVERASKELIRELNGSGSLLLLCDGLDECPPSLLESMFSEAIGLSADPDARVMITSRPRATFDQTISGLGRSNAVNTWVIQPLGAADIKRFLAHTAAENTALPALLNNQNLRDLASSPLALSLLQEAAPVLESRPTWTASDLFENYVSTLLQREDKKGRSLDIPAIRRCLEKISWKMHQEGTHLLRESDLGTIEEGVSANLLLGLPLLKQESLGRVSFSHRALQEYFLARAATKTILAQDPAILSYSFLGRETIAFIADMEVPSDAIAHLENAFAESKDNNEALLENASAILSLRRQAHADAVPGIQLRTLYLKNIKCFSEISLDFTKQPDDGGIFIVLGENGVGKSTLLQCISLCAMGPAIASDLVELPSRYIREGESMGVMSASFEVTGLNGSEVVTVQIGMEIHRESRQFTLLKKGPNKSKNADKYLSARSSVGFKGLFIAGYGPSRSIDALEESSLGRDGDILIERIRPLFSESRNLMRPQHLRRLLVGDGASFASHGAPKLLPNSLRSTIAKTLRSLLPSHDEDFTSDGEYAGRFGTTALTDLSDGYKSTLAWAGHLLVHMLEVLEWTEAIGLVSGIVLIDEIDLHLHPRWQRVVVEHIRKAFPRVQFIASTHSPLVAAGADAEGGDTMLLAARDDEVGVATDLPAVNGWRADQILASPLFGHIIERDPRTERVLLNASILAGKPNKSTDEQQSYDRIVALVRDLVVPDGQTLFERDLQTRIRKAITDKITRLEEELSLETPR